MPAVLIVEDNPSHAREVKTILSKLGINSVETTATVAGALEYLHDVAERTRQAPDLIVLDLGFSMESGFEVLRHWKGDESLKKTQIVVWTEMGQLEQEMCHLFGLKHVVPKWAGPRELQAALQSAVQECRSSVR